MRSSGILVLLGLALLVGWFVPDADLVTPTADPAIENAHSASYMESVEGDEAAETVLERQQDGHFYANVDVNNDEIRFMVDTGASGIALTGEDAETLGLSWSDNELAVVGRGVSGNVYGKRVKLSSVQLDDLQMSDVDAVIIPHGLDVSLLGQSFLSTATSVKIENDEMIIS